MKSKYSQTGLSQGFSNRRRRTVSAKKRIDEDLSFEFDPSVDLPSEMKAACARKFYTPQIAAKLIVWDEMATSA